MLRRRSLLVVWLLVALVTACATDTDGDGEDASAVPTSTAGPAGTHLDWFLTVLNGAPVGDAEFERRFTARFRQAIPLASFLQVTEGLVGDGPYEFQGVVTDGPQLVATVVGSAGGRFRIRLEVDADGRVAGLLVQPAPALADPPTTLDEAVLRLEEFGEVALLAATVGEDRTCQAIVDRNADSQAPIGSIFKLYVLGAVADAVADGRLDWDAELALTAADRSIGAGGLAGRADGSVVTVREAVELMIAISDNIATDLLMRTVGRDAVEAALDDYGHAEPSRNQPFATTREMTLLKLDADAGQRWAAGDETTRRAVLAELADDELDIDAAGALGLPLSPDVLEWFASPFDLCRALVRLWDRSTEPSLNPIADILTSNPGQPDESGRWSEIAFKGGSEPGLLAAAWLVETDDGRTAVLAASVLNPTAPFDSEEALLLMAAARDLLPNE